MPVRKRSVKRRGLLDSDEEAWLRGAMDCGFVQFMPWDHLATLWETFGDKERYEWRPGMYLPKQL